MARRLAELPKGSRISDYISLGVIAKTFPADKIEAVLAATGKASVRRCELVAASFRASSLLPPRDRKAFHEAVLEQKLEKMSGYPLRRNQPISPPIQDIEKHIRIVK